MMTSKGSEKKKEEYGLEFDIRKKCKDYWDKLPEEQKGGELGEINLKKLKLRVENEVWKKTDAEVKADKCDRTKHVRGATIKASFSKGDQSRQDSVRNYLTASTNFSHVTRISLDKGLIKGLGRKETLQIKFDPKVDVKKHPFDKEISFDPSEEFKEVIDKKDPVKNETFKDLLGLPPKASTATITSYQWAYTGKFTCDVVLKGKVKFTGTNNESLGEQYIGMIMKDVKKGITSDGKKVKIKMKGECEMLRDVELKVEWN